jgi:hypothetical protein
MKLFPHFQITRRCVGRAVGLEDGNDMFRHCVSFAVTVAKGLTMPIASGCSSIVQRAAI